MISVLGIVLVLGAIAGGYLVEHGKFAVLVQPAELIIIFGAAVGTAVIASPAPSLIQIGQGLAGVFSRGIRLPRLSTWKRSR
jgi:chemotaxis protein MotA